MRVVVGLLVVVCGAACDEVPPGDRLSAQDLMDPMACAGCHPEHHRQWSGSMHAYASRDPVFLAQNARAQREVSGGVGDFCVRCHAPVARHRNTTFDGLNLPELPAAQQGVTCFACHAASGGSDRVFNLVTLADDGVMRGPFPVAAEGAPHDVTYSPSHDRNDLASSSLFCGTCHDEQYGDWRASLYGKPGPGALSCGACHMRGRLGVAAAIEGSPQRRIHDHAMPGVDVAFDTFPDRDIQRRAIAQLLGSTLRAELCVENSGGLLQITATLENVGAGHGWPGGALQNRRAWVELVGYRADEVLFSSGLLDDETELYALEDPQLWWFGTRATKSDGTTATMPWDASLLETSVLPAPTAPSREDPTWIDTHVARTWVFPLVVDVERVTFRVRLRQVGLDILRDLADSKDLDRSLIEELETLSLRSTELEWRADAGRRCASPRQAPPG